MKSIKSIAWSLGVLAWALALAGCSGKHGGAAGQAGGSGSSKGVSLSPNPAFAASRIDVVFEDPWVDPAKCRFVWRRNNSVVDGATTSSLDPTHFGRGERVSVEVTLADSAGAVAHEWSASTDVVNTPPTVTAATLFPGTVSGDAVVMANVESADPDGDAITYEYRWFKNDDSAPIGTGASFPVKKLGQGDRVAVEVVANDGQNDSPAFRSQAFAVDNRAPEFTSQPRAPKPTDTEFRYQATATDLDGDPLTYEVVNGPSGMTVDPTGVVVWPLPAQKGGDYPVEIKVTDPKGGQAVQEFSVHLDPAAAK
ncbi:MAG: putative Ig domain-containing protein [Candidatus Eiseniibacteriota bacterium]